MSKNTLISLGLLAALILIGLFYQEGSSGGGLKWKNHDKPFTKVVLNKSERSVVLTKKESAWEIGEKGYLADPVKVDSVLTLLTNERSFELISSYTNGYPKYGLDVDNRIEVGAFEGDKEVKKLIVGDTSASDSHTYVILDQKGHVYQAEGTFRNDLDKEAGDFREQKMISFQRDELVSLEIVDAKGTTQVITRTSSVPDITNSNTNAPAEVESYWSDDQGNKLKENEMNDIINTLASLSAETFINKATEDYSSSKYERKFFIKTTSSTHELSLIGNWDDGGHEDHEGHEDHSEEQKECVLAERKTGFTISKSRADKLLVSYETLKE